MGKSLKGKELGLGITQRKDGLYQGTYTDSFGKRKFVYGKTLKEISKKLNEKKHENEIGISVNPQSYTLNEWFDVWLKNYKINILNTSKANIYYYYQHIRKSQIGNMRIDKINSLMIQNVINSIENYPSRRKAFTVIHDMYNRAVKLKIIKENIVDDVVVNTEDKIPANERVLNDNEVELVRQYSVPNYTINKYIIIALNTGMRCGEILGLRWGDIDFENGVIHVRHTYIIASSPSGMIKELHNPKTRKGVRDIPMTKEAKETLIDIRTNNTKLIKDNEYKNFVFLSKKGTGIKLASINSQISNIVKSIKKHTGNEFENFTSHALRRTFATRAIRNGMNPKMLQYILGHSSLSMTMDLYCKVLENDVKEQMKFIGEMPTSN